MSSPELRPLLVLEVNEVPWRIIDHFRGDPRFPALGEFFSTAQNFTTFIESQEELSPWITWPTLHRGLTPEGHGVRFLGQDPGTFRGTPIWEEFTRQGHSVAICGSLQSWPAVFPGAGGFYLPDTFASDAKCYPRSLNAFQRLNLRMTSENGRTRDVSGPPFWETAAFCAQLPFTGIRARTLAGLASQLVRERVKPALAARRPIFQAILAWDIFLHHFDAAKPPQFASFFTNHVASAMHRYWSHLFPQDFGGPGTDRAHLKTMEFAISVLDDFLADALELQRRNPRILLAFASSMGQAAKVWEGFEGYSAIVRDPLRLAATVAGLREAPAAWTRNLAMVPQSALCIPSEKERDRVVTAFTECRSSRSKPLFRCDVSGNRVSVSISTPPPQELRDGVFLLGSGERVRWETAGIEVRDVEPGTAYHIPEGVLALRGEGIEPTNDRPQMRLEYVKAHLLERCGLQSGS